MAEFINNPVAAVQMPVPIKANGDIAVIGETEAGVKKVTIDGISSAASLAQASTVFNVFYGTIGNTDFDSLSAKKTITQGVS